MEDDGHEAQAAARKMSAVDKAVRDGRTGVHFLMEKPSGQTSALTQALLL
jgi:hypothetical protein